MFLFQGWRVRRWYNITEAIIALRKDKAFLLEKIVNGLITECCTDVSSFCAPPRVQTVNSER